MYRLLKDHGFKPPLHAYIPICDNWKPELEKGPLCSEKEHILYMQIIGVYLWIVLIGRIDIMFAVSSLSQFSAAASQKENLHHSFQALGYLCQFPDKQISVDPRPMPRPLLGTLVSKNDPEALRKLYPDAVEEIDLAFPVPRGSQLKLPFGMMLTSPTM